MPTLPTVSVPGWGVRIDDSGRDAEVGQSGWRHISRWWRAGCATGGCLPVLDPEVHKLSIGKVALLALFRELTQPRDSAASRAAGASMITSSRQLVRMFPCTGSSLAAPRP